MRAMLPWLNKATRSHTLCTRSSRRDQLLPLAAIDSDQARRVTHVLGGREVVVEADRVGQIADPALDLQRLAGRVVTEHPRLPVRDFTQAEQHQDGGGLAGAVRTE